MVDDYSVRNKKRLLGEVTKRLSPVTYEVDVGRKTNWKRHVDQMIKGPPEVRRSARLTNKGAFSD